MKKWLFLTFVVSGIVTFFTLAALSQVVIKNPSAVAFICPDHLTDDQHEIDIVRVSDGTIVQTLLGGDPALNMDGEVVIPVNVQPVGFGLYRFIARAVAGGVRSDNSAPSPIWERAPGKPTGVEAR